MSQLTLPRASHASGLAPSVYPPMPNPSTQFTSYPNASAQFPPHPSVSGQFAPPPNASGQFSARPPSAMGPAPAYSSTALSRPQSRLEPPPLASTAGPMPGTRERPLQGPKKRLIMTCDGTWLNYDNGIVNGHKQPPSNVSRLGWALKDTSRDGIPQIVNYQAGVGTEGGPINKVLGGATGSGLKENVREAYTYIATNWREGDDIFLIGFSRGAFTVRCVASMIGQIGLLTRKGLPSFNEIFEDFEHQNDTRYQSRFHDIPFPNKGPFNNRYIAELKRRNLTVLSIPIKAVCCFDTVGSLGIPQTPVTSLFASGRSMKDYQFYDTSLHPCIENAFQALALDEHRAPFSPALWEKRSDNDRTNLKQVWFPGVHANIGGGYDDQEISNITLAWMMSRLEPFLDFRPDFLIAAHDENTEYYRESGQKPRWWSFGEIYRSLKGAYALAGSKVRTPGNYYRVDPRTMRPTDRKLKNTNEYIHASVRTRLGLQGPGIEDRGVYDPKALKDWTFETEPPPPGMTPGTGGPGGPGGGGGNMADGGLVVWTNRGADKGGQSRIPEAVLFETELALLRQSPRVEEFVKNMKRVGGRESRDSRKRPTTPGGGRMNGNMNGAAMSGGLASPFGGRPSGGDSGLGPSSPRPTGDDGRRHRRRKDRDLDGSRAPRDSGVSGGGRPRDRSRRRSARDHDRDRDIDNGFEYGGVDDDASDIDVDLDRDREDRRQRRKSKRYYD